MMTQRFFGYIDLGRSKPSFRLGMLGDSQTGKTTLLAAISKAMYEAHPCLHRRTFLSVVDDRSPPSVVVLDSLSHFATEES